MSRRRSPSGATFVRLRETMLQRTEKKLRKLQQLVPQRTAAHSFQYPGRTGFNARALPVQFRRVERVFREYGLPRAILSDNGSPFGSPGLGRLSRLSLWWIRLGISIERIVPGHPEQNGAHERMHRTLKAETARPPESTFERQQQRFDRFRQDYNHERPREALGQKRAATVYTSSPRPYPEALPPIEYAGHRKADHTGMIRWNNSRLFLSHTLHGETVGLEEIDDGVWSLYYGPVLLARFDERERRFYG